MKTKTTRDPETGETVDYENMTKKEKIIKYLLGVSTKCDRYPEIEGELRVIRKSAIEAILSL